MKQSKGSMPSEAEGDRDVRHGLGETVQIINEQVQLIRELAKRGRLEHGDALLLGHYVSMLCKVANEERHQAALTTSDLGNVSDEDLERMAEEALASRAKK